ncbi:MAG: hypothetical protein ACOYOQ_16595, partial [Microthrixaceae bacterium]
SVEPSVAEGSARVGPTSEWQDVHVALTGVDLVIAPRSDEGTTTRWTLDEIKAVEQVSASPSDQFIAVRAADGNEVGLKVPPTLVAELVRQLQDRQSTRANAARQNESGQLPGTAPGPSEAATTGGNQTVIDLTRATSTGHAVVVSPPPLGQLPPPLPPQWVSPPPPAPAPPASAPEADSPSFTVKPRRSWRAIALTSVCLIAVTAMAAAAFNFHSQSVAAKELAATRGRELAASQALVTKTKGELDAVTNERNELKQRVSEVTNEKAQAQDERNAARELARLGSIAAQQMLDCRNRLIDAMRSFIYGDYATSELDAAVPVCQQANSAVAAFSDASNG